jgi:hypothetical protein
MYVECRNARRRQRCVACIDARHVAVDHDRESHKNRSRQSRSSFGFASQDGKKPTDLTPLPRCCRSTTITSMTEDLNNPYAPPTEVTEPPWSLTPDTEFLFNDEFIAAVGTLTLPKVCVLTGQRTELVQRTSTLHATPRWLQVIPAVVFAAIIPAITYFFKNLVLVKGFREPFILELRAMIVRSENCGAAQHVTETTARGNEGNRKFST